MYQHLEEKKYFFLVICKLTVGKKIIATVFLSRGKEHLDLGGGGRGEK
jgi:hypothetical protein